MVLLSLLAWLLLVKVSRLLQVACREGLAAWCLGALLSGSHRSNGQLWWFVAARSKLQGWCRKPL